MSSRTADWDGESSTIELPVAEPTRVHMRDVLVEALAYLGKRPGRSALTMLGTVLGVGAFVAVLGIASTASGQIKKQVAQLEPTTVTVDDVGAERTTVPGDNPPLDLPADADSRIDSLHGVVNAGTYWTAPLHNPIISAQPTVDTNSPANIENLTLFAASPGTLAAIQPTVRAGTLYNAFHQKRAEHVAVLGIDAARRLGIADLVAQPAVFVNDTAFTVVGIVSNAQRLPEADQGILIPTSTAEALYGPPAPYSPQGGGARILIQTRIGAADQVARDAPFALDPVSPGLLHASAPPDSQRALRDAVGADVSGLFLLLAAVCLVVGALGIANASALAVRERTGEIGLRRALGAQRRHIAAHFLTQSAALGTFGAVLGTSLGVVVILSVAAARHWTAELDPTVLTLAPLLGIAVGLAAGLYPAIRAANLEPVEALRRIR